jgi:DNA polymerase-4
LAVDIAKEVKQRIREQLHLTASAGISYNKFLAKIASDYRKPDGICTIHPDVALSFIDKLKIENFWGVGPKTAQQMHYMGIFTGADLRQVSLKHLQEVFGNAGIRTIILGDGLENLPSGMKDGQDVNEWFGGRK